jgi:UDP-N-acetylglucosamine 2-epimerase (non-hydrolysing)
MAERTQSTVISVVGARPNFMKAAPVREALMRMPGIRHVLVHTGQHYDPNMSDVFFEDLGMGKPDVFLGIGSGSHAEQTARVMVEFEKVCLEHEPDLVVVYGDVNSTIAAALVAKKLGAAVAHVEAGLRSYDRGMPEEINRILTDAITDLYFVTEESGRMNLVREGAAPERVHLVGNTMIDSLARLVERLGAAPERGEEIVLTLHRPSNVDDPSSLARLIAAVEEGAGGRTVVFPVHPRTASVLDRAGLRATMESSGRWRLLGPAGYREFIELVRSARAVVTDSGGIQEETTWLGIPCVTLRETTERPSTVELGTNQLVGVEPSMVRDAIARACDMASASGRVPPMWDGHAAERIARLIQQFLDVRSPR